MVRRVLSRAFTLTSPDSQIYNAEMAGLTAFSNALDVKNCAAGRSLKRPRAAGTSSITTPTQTCSAWADYCPKGMAFPFDFGFVPSTFGDDGHPLAMAILQESIAAFKKKRGRERLG
jgi:hypothetical protein